MTEDREYALHAGLGPAHCKGNIWGKIKRVEQQHQQDNKKSSKNGEMENAGDSVNKLPRIKNMLCIQDSGQQHNKNNSKNGKM